AKVCRAAQLIAGNEETSTVVLLLAPQSEEAQRRAVASIADQVAVDIVVVPLPDDECLTSLKTYVLRELLTYMPVRPRVVAGESWTEDALATMSVAGRQVQPSAFRIQRLHVDEGQVVLESARSGGKVRAIRTLAAGPETT